MDRIVLFKIASLHARTSPDSGLSLRIAKDEVQTGTIVAHLDDRAAPPANFGLIDLETGAIKLQWAVTAELPIVADAFAGGTVAREHSAPVRVALEESGQVLEDDSGFSVKGTGRIEPGSLLGKSMIPLHVNLVKILPDGRVKTFSRALSGSGLVRCAFVSESSYLDLGLPKSLGGGKQRLNVVGGFSLQPVMTLPGTKTTR
jgi:hypothetical protein